MSIGKLIVRDLIIDPARAKELINPEFSTDNEFFLIANDRGQIGGRYDALPAAVAAEPTAFGCVFCEVEGEGGLPTLVAILWDGVVTRLHKLPPVDITGATLATEGAPTRKPIVGEAIASAIAGGVLKEIRKATRDKLGRCSPTRVGLRSRPGSARALLGWSAILFGQALTRSGLPFGSSSRRSAQGTLVPSGLPSLSPVGVSSATTVATAGGAASALGKGGEA